MIIVDTREQKPLWEEKEFAIKVQKLDEGDYTIEELLNKAHIERKSGIDLYGSIIQGHDRFRREILRAKEKNMDFAVFVECLKEEFIGKKFKGGYRLKCHPAVLRKIVATIQDKYQIDFVWCDGREELKIEMLKWFEKEKRIWKERDKQNAEIAKN